MERAASHTYYAVIILIVLDGITTIIGLEVGLTETNPHATALVVEQRPYLGVQAIVIGKLVLLLGLDKATHYIPYQHPYRLTVYIALALVHLQVVAGNILSTV